MSGQRYCLFPLGERRAGSDVNISPMGSSGDLAADQPWHSIALLSRSGPAEPSGWNVSRIKAELDMGFSMWFILCLISPSEKWKVKYKLGLYRI